MPTFEEKHRVRLVVNGNDYVNWQNAQISYGIETVGRTFAFTATGPTQPVDFGTDSAFELFVGESGAETKVITGWTDTDNPSYGKATESVSVSGRSKVQDIVDCSVIGKHRFNNLRIEDIAKRLAAEYDTEVVLDLPPGQDTGAPIARFVADHGETVFEAIERAARLRSLLLFDDAEGRLVLFKAAPGTFAIAPGTSFERGRNVLAGSGNFDSSEVYTEYRVKGQSAGSDDAFGAPVTGIGATALDTIARRRVLVLPSDNSVNPALAKARAEWEAAQRVGRASIVEYKVRGWFDDAGNIWNPGRLYPVDDAFLRVAANLLLVNAALSVDGSEGHVASLTLAPESGYFAQLPSKPREGLGAWPS